MSTMMISSDDKRINELLEKARDYDLILESAQGQKFLLVPLDRWHSFDIGEVADFAAEVEITGKNEEIVSILAERHRDEQKIPLSAVKQELGLE